MAPRPRSSWSVLLALSALVAGLLFGTSAQVSRGTDLRAGRRLRLNELIATERLRMGDLDRRAHRLREQVDEITRTAAAGDAEAQRAQDAAATLAGPAGLTAVTGPGVVVTLDDAPRLEPGAKRPGNPTPDDLVVHEQDILAVINALWAGGAEAVTVMGERITATSVARCVGNTLLLHGAVYSPPFVIAGIGDPDRLEAALDAAPDVSYFRSFVRSFGLGYEVEHRSEIKAPAYDGPLRVTHAAAIPR